MHPIKLRLLTLTLLLKLNFLVTSPGGRNPYSTGTGMFNSRLILGSISFSHFIFIILYLQLKSKGWLLTFHHRHSILHNY